MLRRLRITLGPDEAKWLGAGYLLTLSSSFGQTFFISLSGAELRQLLQLSHGDFGGLYTLATGASAILMLRAGQLADRPRLAPLGLAMLGGLALACLLMASTDSVWQLLVALFLLRFFGQGMLSQVSMTAMARWFEARRGRAIALATMGYPTGEALLPSLVVLTMALAGWRAVWVLGAAILLFASLPLLRYLLAREPDVAGTDGAPADGAARQSWTRRQVLRDPLFYLLQPGLLAVSFMTTGVFFHQALLVEVKGWTLAWFAASYPVYAVTVVVVSLAVGWAVDRWGAKRLLALYLLPMGLAFLLLASGTWSGLAPLFMLLSGITVAAGFVILGALWAELYGTRHIGAIRALVMGAMVASTAASPGLMGWLVDQGIGLDAQFQAFAYYCFAATALFTLLVSRHPRLA